MLDQTKIRDDSEVTEVPPSDNIFQELGNNTYDLKDLISELIDNSIAAKRENTPLKVEIDIFIDESLKPITFVIRDNASGIAEDRLGKALSPAFFIHEEELNEHGMGMKQAIAALGTLNYLATKTVGEKEARVIKELKYGSIKIYRVPFDLDAGTEICIKETKAILKASQQSITMSLVPYLGARYRRSLRPDNKILDLVIRLKKQIDSSVIQSWDVKGLEPIYFNRQTRHNEPTIRMDLSGNGWAARLVFGYAPDREKGEYEELGLSPPEPYHPYFVSLAKQGLDLIRNNRVVKFHQLSEIGIVEKRHNSFNSVRGEIELKSGFKTAITKNHIIEDENFQECVSKIRAILNGEEPDSRGKKRKYLREKVIPDDLPENLLRDRLRKWLLEEHIAKRDKADTEYVVEGIEGYIDIRAEKDSAIEAWEIKTIQASAIDVYQLFMYMDVGEIDKGFLLAPDFSTGAKVAAEHINDKHGKQIMLQNLSLYPITDAPSSKEMDEYF